MAPRAQKVAEGSSCLSASGPVCSWLHISCTGTCNLITASSSNDTYMLDHDFNGKQQLESLRDDQLPQLLRHGASNCCAQPADRRAARRSRRSACPRRCKAKVRGFSELLSTASGHCQNGSQALVGRARYSTCNSQRGGLHPDEIICGAAQITFVAVDKIHTYVYGKAPKL